jgi:hypothetical protein
LNRICCRRASDLERKLSRSSLRAEPSDELRRVRRDALSVAVALRCRRSCCARAAHGQPAVLVELLGRVQVRVDAGNRHDLENVRNLGRRVLVELDHVEWIGGLERSRFPSSSIRPLDVAQRGRAAWRCSRIPCRERLCSFCWSPHQLDVGLREKLGLALDRVEGQREDRPELLDEHVGRRRLAQKLLVAVGHVVDEPVSLS